MDKLQIFVEEKLQTVILIQSLMGIE